MKHSLEIEGGQGGEGNLASQTSRMSVRGEPGDIEGLMYRLEYKMHLVDFPENSGQQTGLKLSLGVASVENPLSIFVGSCPDYSNNGMFYTYEGLSCGVPLLTSKHVECDFELLAVLDEFKIPYRYTVMVADVEATDDFFCRKYTDGDEAQFIKLCEMSAQVSKHYINISAEKADIKGELRSSTFFQEFGRDRFMALQQAYQQVLNERRVSDSHFAQRVNVDTIHRYPIYKEMYGENLKGMRGGQEDDFLASRTIRTMAQYLTLGRLIYESVYNPVIIAHPTLNIGMFNARNKFKLPEDGKRDQMSIPIFQIRRSVYE